MSRDLIEFLELEFIRTPIMLEDKYALTPSRGWMWLQRSCLWILRKLRCNAWDEETSIERHVIDCADVMEAIDRQYDVVREWGRTPEVLLIGSEDFRELAGGTLMHHPHSFSVSAKYGGPNGMLFEGMRVVVLPWLKGHTIIPKLDDIRPLPREDRDSQ